MKAEEAIERISKLKNQAFDNLKHARQLLEVSIHDLEEKSGLISEKEQLEIKENITRLNEFTHQLHDLENSINIHHHVTIDVLQSDTSTVTISQIWQAWGMETFSAAGHITAMFLLNEIPKGGKEIWELVFMAGAISIAIREIIENLNNNPVTPK